MISGFITSICRISQWFYLWHTFKPVLMANLSRKARAECPNFTVSLLFWPAYAGQSWPLSVLYRQVWLYMVWRFRLIMVYYIVVAQAQKKLEEVLYEQLVLVSGSTDSIVHVKIILNFSYLSVSVWECLSSMQEVESLPLTMLYQTH